MQTFSYSTCNFGEIQLAWTGKLEIFTMVHMANLCVFI